MSFGSSATEESLSRIVLLVATPLNEHLNQILFKLGATVPSTAEPIDWFSRKNHSLPPISRYVCFARHLAVGVVDTKHWKDSELTLLEKLLKARYWEHQGSKSCASTCKMAKCGKPGDCGRWNENSIRSIEAIEVLGEIDKSDGTISVEFFSKLWQGWAYLPVWWNCQDFAIRLAYLITGAPDTVRRTLSTIAINIRCEMIRKVIGNRVKTMSRCAEAICVPTGIFSIGLGVLSIVFPPASAPAGVLLLASNGVGFTWAFTAVAEQIIYQGRVWQWKTNMQRLQKDFPLLEDFHKEILEGCAKGLQTL